MIIENQITKLFSPLSGRFGRLELSVIPLSQFAATVPQFSFRCEPPPRLYYCGWGMFLALSYRIRRGRRLLAAKLIQFNADWPQVGDVTVHYREAHYSLAKHPLPTTVQLFRAQYAAIYFSSPKPAKVCRLHSCILYRAGELQRNAHVRLYL